jgi:hypothetical protein
MLMSNHASVKFAGVCVHLPKLSGPLEVFDGVVDFEDEKSGCGNSLGCLCGDIIVNNWPFVIVKLASIEAGRS